MKEETNKELEELWKELLMLSCFKKIKKRFWTFMQRNAQKIYKI